MKYPRIPHVTFSRGIFDDDLVFNGSIFNREWHVTEKMDGSQMGTDKEGWELVARNRNTIVTRGGVDRQFHILPAWLKDKYQIISDLVGDRYILFGEWLFHLHTVPYDKLPDWFLGFNLYDTDNEGFLPFLEGRKMISDAGLFPVPLLDTVVIKSKKQLLSYIKTSTYGSAQMEGLVLHSTDGRLVVKYVTGEFKESIDSNPNHWRRCERTRNKIKRD